MGTRIVLYEGMLRSRADRLERMEDEGRFDARYRRALRQWLELLAAYQYEVEIDEAGEALAAVV